MTTTGTGANGIRKLARSRHQPVGRWIRSEKRLAIYLRDRLTCLYCLADLHGAAPADLTLDHLVARSDGGSNEAANLVTACRRCNSSRQDKPLGLFAGPETRSMIARNCRRSLRRYLILARAIMAGERRRGV